MPSNTKIHNLIIDSINYYCKNYIISDIFIVKGYRGYLNINILYLRPDHKFENNQSLLRFDEFKTENFKGKLTIKLISGIYKKFKIKDNFNLDFDYYYNLIIEKKLKYERLRSIE